jgi:hypothetical protein
MQKNKCTDFSIYIYFFKVSVRLFGYGKLSFYFQNLKLPFNFKFIPRIKTKVVEKNMFAFRLEKLCEKFKIFGEFLLFRILVKEKVF